MQITKVDKEKNQVELTIEVSVDEIRPYLNTAALKLSQKNKIPGFRPGKAPYDLVKTHFGDMAILQEALDNIINQTFYQAVSQEKLETIGSPDIKLEKVAPDNPLVYKATVAILPKVILGNWQHLSIQKNEAKATDEEINKTIDQLRQMAVKETVVDRAIQTGDKAEVDFEVSVNKAVIEGGKSNKYPVVIGEGRMIPGFEDKLIGLKAGQETSFSLKFPEKYFQNNLANKLADFKVKIIAVYERHLPELNDEYAKTIGFDTVAKLKEQLKNNITQDKEQKEEQRAENEAVSAIVKNSQIGDLPDVLIHNEVHKMIHELEHSITSQGMDMAGYLKSIHKTHDDLHKDFEAQGIERIKAALVLRQVALSENIKVEEAEIDEEIKKQRELYKNNKEALKNLSHPSYRSYLGNMLVNQKVMSLIKNAIIKPCNPTTKQS